MTDDKAELLRYRLDARRHAEISKKIIAENFQTSRTTEKPRAVIVAGPPGAGKGRLAANAMSDAGEDGAVLVNVDDYRVRHPNYLDLCLRNDRTAAHRVQHDAAAWADELRDAAIAERRNLVIDGTLKSPDKAEQLCRKLKSAGYQVEVRAMAVDRQTSDAGVYLRYERDKVQSGWGRWVPEKPREEADEGLPRSVEALEKSGTVDRFRVYKRGQHHADQVCVHDSAISRDNDASVADAIRAERQRQRTPEEKAILVSQWDETSMLMKKRNANPNEPDVVRARQLARAARRDFEKSPKASNPSLSDPGKGNEYRRKLKSKIDPFGTKMTK